jgi:hypothetical protein
LERKIPELSRDFFIISLIYIIFYFLGSSIGSAFSSFISGALSFLFFLDFTNKKIPPAATTRQHIHTIGLTANHAIHIVRNHTIIVNHKAIILVPTPMIFARKGRTLAKVSMNWNSIANPQYIKNNQNNLRIQVIILFASCAAWNISAADTLPWSSNAIDLQFVVL